MRFGVSYFGNRMLEHARKDFQHLKDMGFEILVHTYSENDFAFYRDTMKELINTSVDMGFEVWADPWGWGGVFGGEAFSGFLQTYPEEGQVNNSGKHTGGACFLSKAFRDKMKEWIDAVADTGASAIFWDEPHFQTRTWNFPQEWTCRCERCQKAFKEKYGYPMPETYNEDISEFRSASVEDFFKELTSYTKKKGSKNILCFLPIESDLYGIRDYETLVKLEAVDNAGSDPYWLAFNKPLETFVGSTSERILELSNRYGKEHHLWIQAFKIPRGKEEELKKAYEVAKSKGINTVLFWGVYACKHMSHIAPDDPDKVWNVVEEILKMG